MWAYMRKKTDRSAVSRGYGISLTGKEVAILDYIGSIMGFKTKSESVRYVIGVVYKNIRDEMGKTTLETKLPPQ